MPFAAVARNLISGTAWAYDHDLLSITTRRVESLVPITVTENLELLSPRPVVALCLRCIGPYYDAVSAIGHWVLVDIPICEGGDHVQSAECRWPRWCSLCRRSVEAGGRGCRRCCRRCCRSLCNSRFFKGQIAGTVLPFPLVPNALVRHKNSGRESNTFTDSTAMDKDVLSTIFRPDEAEAPLLVPHLHSALHPCLTAVPAHRSQPWQMVCIALHKWPCKGCQRG
mmetsp:Transcript_79529/g.137958  ORF Transcript_79529/g.137958 Transcript_79529/m.137958 type:complete len:225 (-) Transcript_79529:288-962(-)